MSITNARFRPIALVGILPTTFSLLASCDPSQQMAGIDGSGTDTFAQGPIEAFGSIVVNGVHYELDDAVIRVNGAVASRDALAIGQVVTVEGYVDARGASNADSVAFESDLRGPVQSVDEAGGVFFVLEQEVQVGPDSTVELGSGNDLGALSVGDFVEVSGFRGAAGIIEATRVSGASPEVELRIIGEVDDVSEGSSTFEIGSLLVDYSNAGLIEGFANGGPSDGDQILAVGDALGSDGELLATRLKLIEDGVSDREGQRAEVEGLITRFVSPTDFDVAGKRSTTNSGTDYEGGTEGDLQLNIKVQIEGRIDTQGTIVASKIEVKDGGAVQH